MTTNSNSSSTPDTTAGRTNGNGFFENLVYRTQKGEKRKRDLSPTPNDTSSQASNNVSSDAQPAKQSHQDGTEHDEKRRRGNYPEDSVAIDDQEYLYHELFGEPDPRAENLDMSLALETVKLKETVAERVVRRRKAADQPFVPRKPNFKGALVKRKQQAQGPVFGMASLMGPDEQALVLALREARKPKVGFLPFEDLPAPVAAPPVTRARAKKIVKEVFCVCKSTHDNTLLKCKFCTKQFHPACVGKGLHGEDGHQGDRQHAARLSDANYYREHGGFTCPDCDEKWFS